MKNLRIVKLITNLSFIIICSPSVGIIDNEDSTKVQSIYKEVRKKYGYDQDFSFQDSILLISALNLSRRINYISGEAQYYDIMGVHERNKSNYSLAIEYHQRAYQLIENTELLKQKAIILNNLGVVYRRLDDLDRAASYHLFALKLGEKINDRSSICVSLNSLGNIYLEEKKYKSAFEIFSAALNNEMKANNLLGIAINYNNIGSVYENQGNFDKAIEFYNKSLDENKKLGSKKGIGICYLSLGDVYTTLNKLPEASYYLQKAIEIHKDLSDRIYESSAYIKLGNLFNKENKPRNAKLSFINGLQIAKSIHSKNYIQEAYLGLSKSYELSRQTDSAFFCYKLSQQYKDSILNEKNAKDLNLKQVIYETGKKDKEIELLKYKQYFRDKKQKIIIGILISGCVFLFILVVLIYIYYRLKRKAHNNLLEYNRDMEEKNRLLTQQKGEILTQHDQIETKNSQLQQAFQTIQIKNNNITDNIRYAVQIQNALLPEHEYINSLLPKSFIYYKPKDLVSGDFYWVAKYKNKIVLAVADCTGHGVTGAFMSILGITALNGVVIDQGITDSNLVLNALRERLITILQQGDTYSESKEGIHMVVCTFDLAMKRMQFSGAINSIILIRENQILQYKGDKMPVSISPEMTPFSSTNIPLMENDMIYLYSDGFYGQFGGLDDKKFSVFRFRNLLQKIAHLSFEEQKSLVDRTFITWKGQAEQVDDILVMGIRV
jgi:serine phosphatase RsbU (regulator of sigma subunit)